MCNYISKEPIHAGDSFRYLCLHPIHKCKDICRDPSKSNAGKTVSNVFIEIYSLLLWARNIPPKYWTSNALNTVLSVFGVRLWLVVLHFVLLQYLDTCNCKLGKIQNQHFLRKNYFYFCWRRRKRRRAARGKHIRTHADGVGFDWKILSVCLPERVSKLWHRFLSPIFKAWKPTSTTRQTITFNVQGNIGLRDFRPDAHRCPFHGLAWL